MWKVEYKKRFLKELSKLPENIRPQVEEKVFKDLICDNPFKNIKSELGNIESESP